MNFPYFIARRIQKPQQNTFSATVSRVGTVSIALAVAVGIVALAVLLGFKETVKQKIFLFGSHIQVTKLTLNQSLEESPLPLHSPAYDQWQSLPNLRHRQAVAHKPCILKTSDELQGALVKGVGRDYDWDFLKQYLVAGRVIQFSDSAYSNDLILSRKIAKKLKLNVGNDVILYFVQDPPRVRKLRVVGIYETHVEEFDNQLILADIALLQRLNNWGADSVGAYEFFVSDFDQLNSTARQLDSRLNSNMRLETITQNYALRQLFDWLSLLNLNTTILLVLVLFVACFNIVSVLLVMVMERTPMIGLLKTLGSPDSQIRRVFWYVGLQLTLRGLVMGNAIGLGICWLQSRFQLIPLDAASYYMSSVPIRFDWLTIAFLNLGVLLLIAFILFVPTLIVSRIRPIEALAFKK